MKFVLAFLPGWTPLVLDICLNVCRTSFIQGHLSGISFLTCVDDCTWFWTQSLMSWSHILNTNASVLCVTSEAATLGQRVTMAVSQGDPLSCWTWSVPRWLLAFLHTHRNLVGSCQWQQRVAYIETQLHKNSICPERCGAGKGGCAFLSNQLSRQCGK